MERTLKGFYNSWPQRAGRGLYNPFRVEILPHPNPRVARRFAPAYPGLWDRTPLGFARSALSSKALE